MEHEPLMTLATVRTIRRVVWDSLGQAIVVEVLAGQEGGPWHPVAVGLTPQAAQQLVNALTEVLDRAPEETTRQ